MSAAVRGRAFQGLLLLSLALGFVVLAWLLVTVVAEGLPRVNWQLLSA